MKSREVIRSKQNAQVKAWKKLLTAKGRSKSQSFLIEGTHLAQEALNWHVPVKHWIMTENYFDNHLQELGLTDDMSVVMIDESIAKDLSATQAPQGVFAEVNMQAKIDDLPTGTRYLLVDRVQDPGNLGTMIRTADAAGYDAIIIGEGSVDIYNEKVIRSTQGSLWHLPVIEMPLDQAIHQLKEKGVLVLATALNDTAISYKEIDKDGAIAVIVGNEGQGVSEKVLAISDQLVYIPMAGHAESLNVGVATGILLFYYSQL